MPLEPLFGLSRNGATVVSAALLAAAIGGCGPRPAEPPPPTAATDRKGAACLGRIEPVGGITQISARSLGGQPSIVARLLVDEGDEVRRGQLVAVLDSRNQLERAWRQAEARVEVARKRVAQVRAGARASDLEAQQAEIARIEAELGAARSEASRQATLHTRGIVSTSLLDRRRTDVESLAQQLRQAQERLKSVAGVREVDVDVAEAELAAARADAARARAESDAAQVSCPVDGRVLAIHTRPGAEVGPRGILEVANTDRMYAVAEVPEAGVPGIQVGQRATIRGDALAAPLHGVVHRLGSQVARNSQLPADPAAFSDARVIEVKVLLDEPAKVAHLIHGQVTVVIGP